MRTDEHSPSNIIPDNYVYVAEECMRIEGLGDALILKEQREIIAAHRAQTGGKYAQVDTTGQLPSVRQCQRSLHFVVFSSPFQHVRTHGPRLRGQVPCRRRSRAQHLPAQVG